MSISENVGIELVRAPAMARVLLAIFERLTVGHLNVTFPDGSHRIYGGKIPGRNAELKIRDWKACRQILSTGDIGVAEAYRDKLIEIPDIPALLLLAMANEDAMKLAFDGSIWGKLSHLYKHFLVNRNTRSGSKKNIHSHYDIGNDFYKLWLDSGMTYSSAIFSSPKVTLEDAQTAKYERLLSRLDVRAGDHILEIGCGWGGFAEYAAETRGVRVTGISLSREQLAWATARVKGKAVESLCEFRFQDYRDVTGSYDAVVSIEMIEAVGQSYWPSYFSKIKEVLKPGGKAGLQAILIDDALFDSYSRNTDFIQQYIFPGGMLLSPQHLKKQSASARLDMEDMFCFGKDYAETLRRWRSAYERELPALCKLGFDENFLRIWRFYYAYCEAGFDAGRTDVCQIVLANPTS